MSRTVHLEVLAPPVVSWVQAHAHRALVHRVSVVVGGPTAVDVDVTISLVDAAGVALSRPWQRRLADASPGRAAVLDAPDVQLEPATMSERDEESAGQLIVTATAADASTATASVPIRVLAARQWVIEPGAEVLALELLAAFVQPNHPSIAHLAALAAARLQQHTGSGSLSTDVGPERIDAIVSAVVQAAHDLGIFYANPPASWIYGQRVRTPGDVLDDKLGTCLDTTVTLAAALEHLGITPVVWIAAGHAFLGWWRQGQRGLPEAASTATTAAAGAVDLGLMGVLETTMITAERRPPRDLFRRACAAARDRYFTGPTDLLGVVDIGMARVMSVYPLPATRRRPDGVVEVVEYRPATSAGAAGSEPEPAGRRDGELDGPVGAGAVVGAGAGGGAGAGAGGGAGAGAGGGAATGEGPGTHAPAASRVDTRAVPARVRAWKNALLDLSLRNPLLNLDQRITALPLLLPGEHLGVLMGHVADDRSVAIRAGDDLGGLVLGSQQRDKYAIPGDLQRTMLVNKATVYSAADSAGHAAAIQRLRYRARTGVQETGANPLVLALGVVHWRLGERDLRAPLVLAPVQLRGVVGPPRIAADPAGAVTVNLSLLEKLRLEFGLVIPELAAPPTLPGSTDVDVDAVVRIVREAFVAAHLPFRVDTEARLAALGFTGYLLWRDLDAHAELFAQNSLVRHLVHSPTGRYVDPAASAPTEGAADPADSAPTVGSGDPADSAPTEGSGAGSGRPDPAALDAVVAATPIPADGSQAQAIAAAREGHSFVLEGPPGTGKSQTITNILADQMSRGRTVLFVAEKGAALDVVRRRLAEIGLLPFTLDLHSTGASSAQVRRQLAAALAASPAGDLEGYQVAASDAEAAASVLRGYADRIHTPGGTGLSLYAARGQQLARGEGPTLTIDAAALSASAEEVAAVRHTVAAAVATVDSGASPNPPWGFARVMPPDGLVGLGPALAGADGAIAHLRTVLTRSGHGIAETTVDAATTAAQLATLARLVDPTCPPARTLREVAAPRWSAARAELEARTERAVADAAPVLAIFEPATLALDLEPVRQAVREADQAFFLWRNRRLVAAAAPVLALARPGADIRARGLPQLIEQVAAAQASTQALVAAWRQLPGLDRLPAAVNLAEPTGREVVASAAAALAADAALLAGLPPALGDLVTRVRSEQGAMPELADALEVTAARFSAVFAAVGSTRADQATWAGADGLVPRWASTEAGRAGDAPHGYRLGRWVAAVAQLAPLEAHFPTARWELLTAQVPSSEAAAALDRGLAAEAVDERLAAGGFTMFDPLAHDRVVGRYVDSAARLRTAVRTVLPQAIIRRRPFHDGISAFGQVGALEREVTRSRSSLSVRQLVEKFGPVIAEVTPCVLVSPDSLARFVPPESMTFDVVVFDEASQIRVEDAIGAMGRGKAVVVAGDSKQMPPWTFGLVSEGADDIPVEAVPSTTNGEIEVAEADFLIADEESILSECVQAGIPRVWLSWHYRSQDESLIAFSNAQYYDGRLSSFPTVPALQHDTGVSFTRVAGAFARTARAGSPLRTNPIEAAAVVEEVLRRWRSGERSIGIVTFNIQQRSLVESMLLGSGEPGLAEAVLADVDGLFVKNLENVQGDERDVVIFSTGFSANAAGALPLNFGPLNRGGGERRLNVAVTRARRRVMVFSSFEPEDLRTEQTSSVGIRHLRAYLELAKYGEVRTPVEGIRAVTTSAAPSVVTTVDRHRDEIAAMLRGVGLEVRAGVGLSDFQVDLALGRPGLPPVVAVLLDGPAWAARLTTADRDALPITVLHETMGWPVVARVWLPAWLADPGGVVERLSDLTHRAAAQPITRRRGAFVTGTSYVVGDVASEGSPRDTGAGPTGGGSGDSAPQDGAGSFAEPDRGPDAPAARVDAPVSGEARVDRALGAGDDGAVDASPDAEPPADPLSLHGGFDEGPGVGEVLDFAPFVPTIRGSSAILRGHWENRRLDLAHTVIRDIVEAEGPISPERLTRLFALSYGVRNVQFHYWRELHEILPDDLRIDEEGFLWPSRWDPRTWAGYRRTPPGGIRRELDDIARREIANCAVVHARASMGAAVEDLAKVVLKEFGGSRLTAAAKARILDGVDLAVRTQRLRQVGGVVFPG